MSWQDENTPPVVGEYRVERRIGAGGMGVVYLAVSPSGRRVALKIIRGEFADDADYRARFRHEIEAARQVSGAFTASVVGADADADPPWMATQYFDAPTLSEHVCENGAFGEDAVRRLGRGLAEALRDIHRAGLVHRDLKPGNVLLPEDGPRVIDFGVARVLSAKPLTRSGKVLGTVSFMAPEQLSTPREVGAAADVFALGGVLTYAATGRGPFDGDTGAPPIAVAMKIAHDAPDLAGGDCHVVGCVEIWRRVRVWCCWVPGLWSDRGGSADSVGDLVPDGEADGHLGSVVGGGHQVAVGSEVG